jgi:hypothetical protein
MIEGLAITPPVLGRISIGKVVEKNGKRLPEKDDEFTVTSLVQNRDGWVNHPMDEVLRTASNDQKLRSIPVRLMFGEPDLSFRVQFSAFDRKSGRPICSGDGKTCKRYTSEGIKSLPCPTPEGCDFGSREGCKPYGRLNVQIEGQDDALASFIFRTTGYNSIRTLSARLQYFRALAGDALPCLELSLKLRAKSTTQSHRAPVYFVDLVAREGVSLEQSLHKAKQDAETRKLAGWDQVALDKAASLGFANGAFEDSEEDAEAVVEEFFNAGQSDNGTASPASATQGTSTLTDKLKARIGDTPPQAMSDQPITIQ